MHTFSSCSRLHHARFFFHQDLVIALQRFRYDLITQESVKLNDRVRFSSKLDMWPYMSTGVTTDDKVVMADYQYELRGVIVHSGVQAGGHYISFVKNAEGNWHEFDDEVVTPFNPNHNSTGFAARGFGGTNSEGAEIDENAYTGYPTRVLPW
jgi:ubiquitin C-terminal hydrolase